MSFYFVDRIFELQKGKSALGIKNVTRSEHYLYTVAEFGTFLNPAILCEAVMQLTSWLIVYSSDFTKKPVVLRIEDCDFFELVKPGDQLTLEVQLSEQENDLFLVDAKAFVDDKLVLHARQCHAYAMNINELSDPAVVRKQFDSIHRPEFKDVSRVASRNSIPIPSSCECRFFAIDQLQKLHSDRKMESIKQFTLAEDFFKDHFPRKPVVPAVVQLTAVGETAQVLAMRQHKHSLLIPKYIRNGKLRKFIHPGSTCKTTVEITSGDPSIHGEEIIVEGIIECESARVMQIQMGFTNFIAKENLF